MSLALIQCISDFAEINSNPVLSVLPDDGVFEYDHKYPEPILDFSGAGLRAYYHCHSWSTSPLGEHGHFHIFVRTVDGGWTHLAGLSMDNNGQPLQWFTVNHWVTGEVWQKPIEIIHYLDATDESADWLLTEKWLWQMIVFYRPVLEVLLADRDAVLGKLSAGNECDDVMQDRGVYILSRRNIELFSDIKQQAGSPA